MNDSTTASPDIKDLPEQSIQLAAEILRGSRRRETAVERARSAQMARMMDDLPGKRFTIAMADQVLRIHRPARAATRLNRLLGEYGVPRYFSALDRLALWAGSKLASWAPGWVMPLIKQKVRKDSAHVIISGEDAPFAKYREQRMETKIRINFNQLGEAVLGDREAERRLGEYLKRLNSGQVDYCSVKLSSIVSQISMTGYRHTVEEIKKRLREVYRAAMSGGKGGKPCFVNLDMEEYRDLRLTVDVFCDVLVEPEFLGLEAGIVLQAYLPDSYAVLQELSQWANERQARGGADIKIRLVKGANLAMEEVEASLHDWPQAPYYSKLESDANYKRMLEYATRPEVSRSIRLGVASHNLFDVAYALLMRERRGVQQRMEFEMLEGMANAQALEVRRRTGDLLVYTPVCYDDEFESAVAYLVRRLDENTAPGSFLGALFALEEGSADWQEQSQAFLQACELAQDPKLSGGPNRQQNRLTERREPVAEGTAFHNEPDTDFSLAANRQWAQQITDKWMQQRPEPVPFVIDGQPHCDNPQGIGRDPSRPGHEAYRYALGSAEDVDRALDVAVRAQKPWADRSTKERATILRAVAAQFANGRADSIGVMLLDAGKSVVEADPEVSEAVDFANYYAQAFAEEWMDGARFNPFGVVVVTPPWNFPYAIPAGGVLAALMAGNSVILKPAPETILTAWHLVQQFWAAGVPQDVLQFLPVPDNEVGKALITDSRTGAVILTGSYLTAQMFQSWRPDLRLYAETSGKNCLVITAAADPDLAIKDLVKGAFGHAGQKCSATSLALVQRELYDNPKFQAQLKDAVESLRVGGSWDPAAVVTPIIREPDENLERGLRQLDEGESWLVEPLMLEGNPCLWRPGVRMGVRPDSWYHRTECFGPVTGLMPYDKLDEAILVQNSSSFGLTGGIHSLDPAEIRHWRQHVEVGNAYINRTTTGAIVQRQPFGGWKDSCVGPGPKAGGPNYVAAFGTWVDAGKVTRTGPPTPAVNRLLDHLKNVGADEELLADLRVVGGSAAYWWEQEFSREHDPSDLHGETNHFRYRPRPWVLIRIESFGDLVLRDLLRTLVGTLTTGTRVGISVNSSEADLASRLKLEHWLGEISAELMDGTVVCESTDRLVERVKGMKFGSLRVLGEFESSQLCPAVFGNIPLLQGHPVANGRVELLNYLKEQSVTQIVHRYGNII